MIIATVTDLKEKIVPDKLIVTGIVVIFILRAFNQVDFINYLLGGLISFGILFAIFLLSGEKMGGADVKIYALIGISIGLLGAINSLFYASIVALILNLDKLKKKNRKKEIPFLPFITIGVLLVYIGG
jgi:leader peptidase (prepilin peptidase)/N-methyltransferase